MSAKPKPTNLRILHGNPGKRPLPKNEPKPKPKRLRCPSDLHGEAAAEWRRASKALAAAMITTDLDHSALHVYCAAYGRWFDAEEKIREEGMIIKSPNNYPIVNPCLGIANRAMDQMRAFMCEFGMTPSSRTRVKVEAPKREDSDAAELFGK